MNLKPLPRVTLIFISYDRSVAVDPERRWVVAAAWDTPLSRPTILARETNPARAAKTVERLAKFYGLEAMVIEPTQDSETTIAIPRVRHPPQVGGMALHSSDIIEGDFEGRATA